VGLGTRGSQVPSNCRDHTPPDMEREGGAFKDEAPPFFKRGHRALVEKGIPVFEGVRPLFAEYEAFWSGTAQKLPWPPEAVRKLLKKQAGPSRAWFLAGPGFVNWAIGL